jgi:hypothetical protein
VRLSSLENGNVESFYRPLGAAQVLPVFRAQFAHTLLALHHIRAVYLQRLAFRAPSFAALASWRRPLERERIEGSLLAEGLMLYLF